MSVGDDTAEVVDEAALIDPAFWEGRRVFITGHTGFIGGWAAFWLSQLGADVTGYALAPPTSPCLYETLGLGDDISSVIADIRDADRVAATLRTAEPEIVLHLAAQPIVRQAFEEPLETLSTNIMGTANLLQAARGVDSVSAIIVYTTDKVYRNREWVWRYRETDELGGIEPYGASKACTEHVVEAFQHSYFKPGLPDAPGIATVRAGNVIGGGDWSRDRLIPDAIRAFTAGEPLVVRNPNASRPWQHVLEPLRATMILAQQLSETAAAGEPELFSGPYNLGPLDERAVPVSDLADKLVALWGDNAAWSTPDIGEQPYEAHRLAVDSSFASHQLGWYPTIGLERAIELTVRWYKTHFYASDIKSLTLGQIEEAAPEVRDAMVAETIYAGTPFIG